MDNLDILVKSLNTLENYTAKYIYKKYIEINDDPETGQQEQPLQTFENEHVNTNTNTNFKYNKKPISKDEYKLYTDIIFSKDRKSIIKQSDILNEDLKNMSLVDKEYEKNPKQFKRQKYNSYPDIKRCSFIRKYKHKLIRCKNSIINDDEDMCSKHEESANIYWDMYNDLLEKQKV